jgi:hypothetical protein
VVGGGGAKGRALVRDEGDGDVEANTLFTQSVAGLGHWVLR